MKTYTVNEVFYSLQGEGALAGTACVFVRFAGCNLTCSVDGEAGFDCDTEFRSGLKMSASELAGSARAILPDCRDGSEVGLILTGGEPALQLDMELLMALDEQGFRDLRIETNGTVPISPDVLDLLWVSCSPKTAEHTLRVGKVDELRYVRRRGQALPRPELKARLRHYFLSPAAGPQGIERADLDWCIELVRRNPEWRLSVQQHKLWRVR